MPLQTKFIFRVLTVACAFGAGITGTLLWVENRPAPVKMDAPAKHQSPSLPNIPLQNPVQPSTA